MPVMIPDQPVNKGVMAHGMWYGVPGHTDSQH